ncbi:MAG: carbohydrate kinase family protein [Acidobacteriota bacterium]
MTKGNLATRPGRIVVTGSVAFDYLMTFPGHFVEHLIPDQMKRLSVSFLVDEMRRVEGGCAANISWGLAVLGETPVLFATAGPDAAGYRERLGGEGVDVSRLKICHDVYTASFFVSTDRDQNQIASFYTGAMARARDLSISEMDASECAMVVISPNDPAAMDRYATECRSAGIPFLYDPSQQVARLSGEDLSRGLEGAAVLIANDYEMGILSQKTGRTAEEIASRVPVVIETHGADGSTIALAEGGQRIRHAIPAAPLEGAALDPTGVGDAFRAGLLRGLRAGLSWEIAGRMGSVAAAFCLEVQGPQPARYTIGAFVARYERSFGRESALAAIA